jgi:Fe-S-cluster-containing hydrogenase component 2
MKLRALGAKDGMSRREFLKVIRLKTHGIPVIDKERCTGCGLCALDCETKALVVHRISGKETYQLLSGKRPAMLAVFVKICPEHCLLGGKET